jgi:hypothetical protein
MFKFNWFIGYLLTKNGLSPPINSFYDNARNGALKCQSKKSKLKKYLSIN